MTPSKGLLPELLPERIWAYIEPVTEEENYNHWMPESVSPDDALGRTLYVRADIVTPPSEAILSEDEAIALLDSKIGYKGDEWRPVVRALLPHLTPSGPCESEDHYNYLGAMAEIEEIVRVARDNPSGLIDFIKVNFPQEWGLTKAEHRALLATQSASPDTQTIIGLLQPIADQDWHGKWRIQKAIAALRGES